MYDNNIVREYEFNSPLIPKVDSMIDDCIRDCHDKYFHTFDHICEYDLIFTNITDIERTNLTISDKSMASYELNKNLTVARGNGFSFIQINKLKVKIYSNPSHVNIHYYLKLQMLIMHRHFFRKLAQNPEYIQTHCNDRRNPFRFACCQWYLYSNPQCS